jgi:uncharacterized membrane protein YjjP (DUF1212 family)
VAKEDAVGFAVLCVALIAPIGFVAFLIALTEGGDDLVFGVSVFAVLLILYFFRIGRRVYGFFSLFVDYELTLRFFCKRCDRTIKEIKLPGRPESV